MARIIYGLMQSLDGYVSGPEGGPGLPMPNEALHGHFSAQMRKTAGSVYGRRMYEIMRFWDGEEAEQAEMGREFALAWRAQPKWVVSRTLTSVGPNTTLVSDDLEGFIKRLKAEQDGEIEVAGPQLAGELTALGLIDEYRMYLTPVVLGAGKPYFAGARPPLRLVGSEQLDDTMLLTYQPA
jgi:dihydrofolate reductase